MSERLNELDSKFSKAPKPSGVQIPLSTPDLNILKTKKHQII